MAATKKKTNKTQPTKQSVAGFLADIKDKQKQTDSKDLVRIIQRASGEKPVMWGSIVGFGSYHYKSERSSQEGDWPITGFSPRAANLTVYVMPGTQKYKSLLQKLGKFTSSKGSCIYIKKLADVDTKVLEQIVKTSVRDMRKKYK